MAGRAPLAHCHQELAIAPPEPVDPNHRGFADQPVLRAKYLDWCSARLADRFLKLTPEEIYARAERAAHAARGDAASSPGSSESSGPDAPSFRDIVERVTAALTAELDLPAFEEWVAAYRLDPDRYEEELLGLWRGAP